MINRLVIVIMMLLFVSGCIGRTAEPGITEKSVAQERTQLSIPAVVYQTKVSQTPQATKSSEQLYLGTGQRPIVSPDGAKLAYVQHGSLIVSWLDGSRVDRVLEAAYFGALDTAIGEYIWADDSQRVGFVVDTSRRISNPRVFAYDLVKQESQLIFEAPKARYQTIYNLRWLDDGQLTYWANDLGNSYTFLVDVAHNKVQQMSAQGEMYSLSPGGPQAAYIKEQNGKVGVYVHEMAKNRSKLICTLPDDGYVLHMTWNQTGDRLVLWGNGVLYVVTLKTGQLQTLHFSAEGKYPEEVFWGLPGKHGQELLVSTMDGIYLCNIEKEVVSNLVMGASFASFLADEGIVYQTKGAGGENQLWASGCEKTPMPAAFPGISGEPLVGAGVKSMDVPNNGPEDGRLKALLTQAKEINPETPTWQTISTRAETYFLNQNWQGYGMLDRLYQLSSGEYYAVVVMYYLEQDAYYPEAYEIMVKSTPDGPQVISYEFLPFSQDFEP